MVLREAWMLVESLALDDRISDKWFRWVFKQLERPNLAHKAMKMRLEILREIAITESERDAHVN